MALNFNAASLKYRAQKIHPTNAFVGVKESAKENFRVHAVGGIPQKSYLTKQSNTHFSLRIETHGT